MLAYESAMYAVPPSGVIARNWGTAPAGMYGPATFVAVSIGKTLLVK